MFLANYAIQGFFETLGADTRASGSADVKYEREWLGTRVKWNKNGFPDLANPAGAFSSVGKLSGWGLLMNMVGPASLATSISAGYAMDGIGGALKAGAVEISTDAAAHHFYYKGATAKAGELLRPGLIEGVFNGLPRKGIMGRAMNTAAWGGLSVAGNLGGFVGGSIGSSLGGAVGGNYGSFSGGIVGTLAGSYAGAAAASALMTPQGMVVGGLAAGTAIAVGSAAAVGYGAYTTLKAGYRYRQMQKGIHTSGSLAAFDMQGAQTMRGRAVQAIHKSHLNSRQALGQEASLLSYPSRNYHSRYRAV
jgi:hypothetical protein